MATQRHTTKRSLKIYGFSSTSRSLGHQPDGKLISHFIHYCDVSRKSVMLRIQTSLNVYIAHVVLVVIIVAVTSAAQPAPVAASHLVLPSKVQIYRIHPGSKDILQPTHAPVCYRILCCCRSPAAATLLLQRCCCNAASATRLLQRGCCNAAAATLLLQRGFCNAAAATRLLQRGCCCFFDSGLIKRTCCCSCFC